MLTSAELNWLWMNEARHDVDGFVSGNFDSAATYQALLRVSVSEVMPFRSLLMRYMLEYESIAASNEDCNVERFLITRV